MVTFTDSHFIEFYQNILGKLLDYEWKAFKDKKKLRSTAKTFGDHLYVGGGSYNRYSGPARINNNGHCTLFWKGLTRNATNCFYLEDIPLSFDWVRSGYKKTAEGAVKFNNIEIGRIIFENGRIYLGKIKNGFLYYDIGNKESKAGVYEVLVFNPILKDI